MTDRDAAPAPRARLFAEAPDGTMLPVIDVTDPAFAVPSSDAELAALAERALRAEERRGPVQRFVMGLALKGLAKRSRLVAALQAAHGGYLAGLPTYVMKLGPANLLPPYDTDLDRTLLESPTVASMRVRLAQVAHLLAGGLAPLLRERPGAPLGLLDIAGGPSADALNALVLLARDGLLAGRRAEVVTYDLDAAGPAFGMRMLAALQSGPLAGLDVAMRHVPGRWEDAGTLGAALAALPPQAIVAATSEGGLFEYGSDAAIVDVLRVLSTRCEVVAGSVTRDDRLGALLRRQMRTKTIPRGLAPFGALAAVADYAVAASRPAPLSDQVLLTRSSSGKAASRR
jgi:hypothetical protein